MHDRLQIGERSTHWRASRDQAPAPAELPATGRNATHVRAALDSAGPPRRVARSHDACSQEQASSLVHSDQQHQIIHTRS